MLISIKKIVLITNDDLSIKLQLQNIAINVGFQRNFLRYVSSKLNIDDIHLISFRGGNSSPVVSVAQTGLFE